MTACCVAAAGAIGAHAHAPKVRDEPNPVAVWFTDPLGEIAGVRAYSGRLTVRPWQAADLLARLSDEAKAADHDQRARLLIQPHVIKHVPETDEYLLGVPAGMGDAEFARQLAATELFQYAEPDWIVWPASIPDDPLYGQQWHLAEINAPTGWDTSTGSPSVIIAVVDGGTELTHPDLQPRLVNGANTAENQVTTQLNGGDVSAVTSHGVITSGIAAAAGNNALGICGVAWNCGLMPVRVTNNTAGTASLTDITAGIRWAAQNGAKVVSASWSGVDSATVETNGQFCRNNGAVLVYPTGNNGAALLPTAAQPSVLVVSGFGHDGTLWPSSNYGACVKVSAPCVDITSTAPGGSYSSQTGTSYAAPIVSGLVGLVWTVNPSLTPVQAQRIVESSCIDVGATGKDQWYGNGRIDVARALRAAPQPSGPPLTTADAAVTLTDTPVLIDVLGNDWDALGRAISITSPTSAAPVTTTAGGVVTLSLGTGPGGRNQVLYTPPTGWSGGDAFSYTVTSTLSLSTSQTATVTVEDAAQYRAPDHPTATGGGVIVDYYALNAPEQLPDFSSLLPQSRQISANVNFVETGTEFGGSGLVDGAGAVVKGYFDAPLAGSYTFYLESDDGSRLWIGDEPAIDNDGVHSMTERSAVVKLQAGLHEFRIEYFDGIGNAGLILRYAGGGAAKQVVPPARLRFARSIADIASLGGWATPDGQLTADDVILFLSDFFANSLRADIATLGGLPVPDGLLTADDIIAFLGAFFAGVPQ